MPKPTSDRRATERKYPWPMVRLGDVCEIIAGQSPEGSYYTDESCYTEFHQGSKCFGARELQVSGVYTKKETKIAKPGALLISVRAPVGDLNVTTRRVCIGRGLAALIPDDSISRDFLWLFLTSATKAVNDAAGAGSCFSSLSRSQLSGLEIPLPPLSVQREIVARLERELATVEKMKKGFEELAETSKAEFKAELKEVFEEISRRGAEMRRLGEIGRVAMCKRVLKAQTSDNGDVPFFKIGTFGKEPNAYISNELFREFVKKFSYPKKGDVLISAAGTIGRTIVFDGKPSYFQDSNIVWLEHDGTMATNEYLHCFYWSKPWKVSDGATIPRIYNGDIESTEIPLPSLSVQRQIVARLSTAKARAKKLEAKAREGVAVCETMRKAILKEAFAPCGAGEEAR